MSGDIVDMWGLFILPHMLNGAGIFTYIYPTNGPNVGKYTIHGASGLVCHMC